MRTRRLTRTVVTWIAEFAVDPGCDEDQRLRQALMIGGSLVIMAAGVVWGLAYIALEEVVSGLIPLSYTALSAASLGLFLVNRRFPFFRFSQLLLILLLPFLLQLSLGGFVDSGAVVLWSVLCPFGALLFDEPKRAPRWFLAFLALVFVSGAGDPFLRPDNNLSEAVVRIFFVANVGAVSGLAFALLYSFIREKNRALELLRLEQEKSDSLLLNILPEEIAAILKNESRTIADHFEGASILFADMVDFTPKTASMEPVEMVELLNAVFSHFDLLVERYRLEKIRTIGDSYMVAAGVPRPRPDHAHALARMALDIREYLQSDPACVERGIDFRIGINSGPVVAGVIGRKKFIYDLWGDAVNTASRMESHGEAGRIHISSATYELIKGDFHCDPRGAVQVKGKGEMQTWYLAGVRPEKGETVT